MNPHITYTREWGKKISSELKMSTSHALFHLIWKGPSVGLWIYSNFFNTRKICVKCSLRPILPILFLNKGGLVYGWIRGRAYQHINILHCTGNASLVLILEQNITCKIIQLHLACLRHSRTLYTWWLSLFWKFTTLKTTPHYRIMVRVILLYTSQTTTGRAASLALHSADKHFATGGAGFI